MAGGETWFPAAPHAPATPDAQRHLPCGARAERWPIAGQCARRRARSALSSALPRLLTRRRPGATPYPTFILLHQTPTKLQPSSNLQLRPHYLPPSPVVVTLPRGRRPECLCCATRLVRTLKYSIRYFFKAAPPPSFRASTHAKRRLSSTQHCAHHTVKTAALTSRDSVNTSGRKELSRRRHERYARPLSFVNTTLLRSLALPQRIPLPKAPPDAAHTPNTAPPPAATLSSKRSGAPRGGRAHARPSGIWLPTLRCAP